MGRLAILTTAAAVAFFGVASAENGATVPEAAPAATQAATSPAPAMRHAMDAYAAFQTDVTSLRGSRINADADLERAITTAVHHNREQLTRGWIAYGAYTAAQSPEFTRGVRDAAAYYGRDAVIWAITADTRYARGLRGGEDAVKLVLDSATADASRVIEVADRYQEMAYGLQRQRWANAVAPQQAARVQRVRDISRAGSGDAQLPEQVVAHLEPGVVTLSPTQNPTAFGGRRFWDAATDPNTAQVVEVASQVSYSWKVNETRGDAVNRMTTLAALQTLEATTPERAQTINDLMLDPRSRDCLEMAQLQLYQCMSAARFRYENAFCLGQHALRDVGTCFSEIAQPDAANMAPIVGAAQGPITAASSTRR